MTVIGRIKKVSAARNVSEDLVRLVTLEIHGSIGELEGLMNVPLMISMEPDEIHHGVASE